MISSRAIFPLRGILTATVFTLDPLETVTINRKYMTINRKYAHCYAVPKAR